MIAIIAEKPSVAREIATIVRATKEENGYLSGGGYMVTWALGHLVALGTPEQYGVKGFHKESLPIIPEKFVLIPRQEKTEKGSKPDPGALKQLRIIKKVFAGCDKIIVATDAGREGELIFRLIYEYLGCTKPFDRLWISSLTDRAIKEGLSKLKSGSEYDNLYYAARVRSEADWLVGINATQAVSIAAGRGTYSLGRVQTPTLKMVCERYLENRKFVSQKFWQLSVGAAKSGIGFRGVSVERYDNKEQAEELHNALRTAESVTIRCVDRKETGQLPPLLYDLTTLQKEANTKHGFSADKTLSLAQKLYELKLTTYPRTGSRFISEDVFEEIPALIGKLKSDEEFGTFARSLTKLSRFSVDDKKVTDHHALLITGNTPSELSKDEHTVYRMVAGRMLEAFSVPCIKNSTTVTTECAGIQFRAKGSVMKQAGWRGLYNETEEKTSEENSALPELTEGETLPVSAFSISEGSTKPKPLHTEATLLGAMENAASGLEDEELRHQLKDCGIGTPATRASIIETLFAREYMVRDGKLLVPTEKGLAIYGIVKSMKIADVEMTGMWEAALAKIETGEMAAATFRKGIEVFASQITAELLTAKLLYAKGTSECSCPKCSHGTMQFYAKVVKCNNPDCGLPIFRSKSDITLTDAQIKTLLSKGKTPLIRGFKSKEGKLFDASLKFDDQFNVVFEFPPKKKR